MKHHPRAANGGDDELLAQLEQEMKLRYQSSGPYDTIQKISIIHAEQEEEETHPPIAGSSKRNDPAIVTQVMGATPPPQVRDDEPLTPQSPTRLGRITSYSSRADSRESPPYSYRKTGRSMSPVRLAVSWSGDSNWKKRILYEPDYLLPSAAAASKLKEKKNTKTSTLLLFKKKSNDSSKHTGVNDFVQNHNKRENEVEPVYQESQDGTPFDSDLTTMGNDLYYFVSQAVAPPNEDQASMMSTEAVVAAANKIIDGSDIKSSMINEDVVPPGFLKSLSWEDLILEVDGTTNMSKNMNKSSLEDTRTASKSGRAGSDNGIQDDLTALNQMTGSVVADMLTLDGEGDNVLFSKESKVQQAPEKEQSSQTKNKLKEQISLLFARSMSSKKKQGRQNFSETHSMNDVAGQQGRVTISVPESSKKSETVSGEMPNPATQVNGSIVRRGVEGEKKELISSTMKVQQASTSGLATLTGVGANKQIPWDDQSQTSKAKEQKKKASPNSLTHSVYDVKRSLVKDRSVEESRDSVSGQLQAESTPWVKQETPPKNMVPKISSKTNSRTAIMPTAQIMPVPEQQRKEVAPMGPNAKMVSTPKTNVKSVPCSQKGKDVAPKEDKAAAPYRPKDVPQTAQSQSVTQLCERREVDSSIGTFSEKEGQELLLEEIEIPKSKKKKKRKHAEATLLFMNFRSAPITKKPHAKNQPSTNTSILAKQVTPTQPDPKTVTQPAPNVTSVPDSHYAQAIRAKSVVEPLGTGETALMDKFVGIKGQGPIFQGENSSVKASAIGETGSKSKNLGKDAPLANASIETNQKLERKASQASTGKSIEMVRMQIKDHGELEDCKVSHKSTDKSMEIVLQGSDLLSSKPKSKDHGNKATGKWLRKQKDQTPTGSEKLSAMLSTVASQTDSAVADKTLESKAGAGSEGDAKQHESQDREPMATRKSHPKKTLPVLSSSSLATDGRIGEVLDLKVQAESALGEPPNGIEMVRPSTFDEEEGQELVFEGGTRGIVSAVHQELSLISTCGSGFISDKERKVTNNIERQNGNHDSKSAEEALSIASVIKTTMQNRKTEASGQLVEEKPKEMPSSKKVRSGLRGLFAKTKGSSKQEGAKKQSDTEPVEEIRQPTNKKSIEEIQNTTTSANIPLCSVSKVSSVGHPKVEAGISDATDPPLEISVEKTECSSKQISGEKQTVQEEQKVTAKKATTTNSDEENSREFPMVVIPLASGAIETGLDAANKSQGAIGSESEKGRISASSAEKEGGSSKEGSSGLTTDPKGSEDTVNKSTEKVEGPYAKASQAVPLAVGQTDKKKSEGSNGVVGVRTESNNPSQSMSKRKRSRLCGLFGKKNGTTKQKEVKRRDEKPMEATTKKPTDKEQNEEASDTNTSIKTSMPSVSKESGMDRTGDSKLVAGVTTEKDIPLDAFAEKKKGSSKQATGENQIHQEVQKGIIAKKPIAKESDEVMSNAITATVIPLASGAIEMSVDTATESMVDNETEKYPLSASSAENREESINSGKQCNQSVSEKASKKKLGEDLSSTKASKALSEASVANRKVNERSEDSEETVGVRTEQNPPSGGSSKQKQPNQQNDSSVAATRADEKDGAGNSTGSSIMGNKCDAQEEDMGIEISASDVNMDQINNTSTPEFVAEVVGSITECAMDTGKRPGKEKMLSLRNAAQAVRSLSKTGKSPVKQTSNTATSFEELSTERSIPNSDCNRSEQHVIAGDANDASDRDMGIEISASEVNMDPVNSTFVLEPGAEVGTITQSPSYSESGPSKEKRVLLRNAVKAVRSLSSKSGKKQEKHTRCTATSLDEPSTEHNIPVSDAPDGDMGNKISAGKVTMDPDNSTSVLDPGAEVGTMITQSSSYSESGSDKEKRVSLRNAVVVKSVRTLASKSGKKQEKDTRRTATSLDEASTEHNIPVSDAPNGDMGIEISASKVNMDLETSTSVLEPGAEVGTITQSPSYSESGPDKEKRVLLRNAVKAVRSLSSKSGKKQEKDTRSAAIPLDEASTEHSIPVSELRVEGDGEFAISIFEPDTLGTRTTSSDAKSQQEQFKALSFSDSASLQEKVPQPLSKQESTSCLAAPANVVLPIAADAAELNRESNQGKESTAASLPNESKKSVDMILTCSEPVQRATIPAFDSKKPRNLKKCSSKRSNTFGNSTGGSLRMSQAPGYVTERSKRKAIPFSRIVSPGSLQVSRNPTAETSRPNLTPFVDPIMEMNALAPRVGFSAPTAVPMGSLLSGTVVKRRKQTKTGMSLLQLNGKVFISKVVDGGLFSGTQLEVGDEVIAVNNVCSIGLTAPEVVNQIAQAEGTVTVFVRRGRFEEKIGLLLYQNDEFSCVSTDSL